MIWNNSYLKSLPFNSVCKKKNAYLPTPTKNFESGDSKQIIFSSPEPKLIGEHIV